MFQFHGGFKTNAPCSNRQMQTTACKFVVSHSSCNKRCYNTQIMLPLKSHQTTVTDGCWNNPPLRHCSVNIMERVYKETGKLSCDFGDLRGGLQTSKSHLGKFQNGGIQWHYCCAFMLHFQSCFQVFWTSWFKFFPFFKAQDANSAFS